MVLKTIIASPKKKTPKKRKGLHRIQLFEHSCSISKEETTCPEGRNQMGNVPLVGVGGGADYPPPPPTQGSFGLEVRSSTMIWRVDYPSSQWKKKKKVLISLIQSRVRWTLWVVMSPIWIYQQSPNWSNALSLCSFGFTLGGALHGKHKSAI